MILYILKTVACAALFLGAYYLLLEKEKMIRFNRVYLLLAIALSFGVPFITFTTAIQVFPAMEKIAVEQEMQMLVAAPAMQHTSPVDVLPFIIFFIYGAVTLFLLVRFGMNIYRINRLIRKNPSVPYGDARLVLVKGNNMPYSFLHYIFVDEQEYKANSIENEVFRHEMEHVRQRHSLDIILIELIIVFAWFNPLLYLYRKAIQLNHEFQADDAVVRSFRDPVAYQYLLLYKISHPRNPRIASPFNYIATKKRLVMMTKHTTQQAAIFKTLIALVITGTAVFMFSTRAIAQSPMLMNEPDADFNSPAFSGNLSDTTPQKTPRGWGENMSGSTREGASAEMMKEYQHIIDTYARPNEKGLRAYSAIPANSKKRLMEIFSQMNEKQQKQQDIIFMPPMKPFEKKVPSEEQMKSFSDPNTYGVWIDNRKVDNAELSKYRNTDFSRFSISRLYGTAKANKPYNYQLNLMTNAYFNKENERLKKNQDEVVLIKYKKQ